MPKKKLWFMFGVALVVGSVLISPYVLFDVDASRTETRSDAHYALLVVHIFTAFIALVLGPLQFIPTIRAAASFTALSAAPISWPVSCLQP